MKLLRIIALFLTCITLVACGGGGGESSSTTPSLIPTNEPGVNIGNISTIPLGAKASSTFLIVTNNHRNNLILTNATYTPYDSDGALSPEDARGPNSPINVEQCAIIQASGSCSIVVNVPDDTALDSPRYLITMNFRNSATGTSYTTSQIISYSDLVPTSPTGITFSTINNTLYNRAGRSTSYTVPFLLGKQTESLSVTSEYDNPAFSPAINCPGNSPYPAGTLCTLYVNISNTGTNSLISGNLIITSSSSLAKVHSKNQKVGDSASGQTGYLFNVPVTVVQNSIGNLVTSAINVIISPADGANAKSVILLNNGAGPTTGISITSTGVVTASNGCPSTLNPGASCSFTVNANQTVNGQSSVIVNYTTGTTSNVLAFNVAYIAASKTPAMTMTTSGTFLNTVINNAPRTLNIKVSNTSTAQLNNIVFTPQSNFPAGMTYGSSGSCKTDGTQSLGTGQSCTLQIQYAPTTLTSGTFTIRQTAQYIAQDGSTGSYTASKVDISYATIAGNAFLYFIPSMVDFQIRADGYESQIQMFTLVNSSSLSSTVNSLSFAGADYAFSIIGGNCGSFPITLPGFAICEIITKFGPTTINVAGVSEFMIATYVANPTTLEIATTSAYLTFASFSAAHITLNNVVVTGNNGGGNGNSATPYQFTNSPTNTLKFVFTYANTGTQNADNFNVALNNLPVGYYVESQTTTCPYGSNTSILYFPGAGTSSCQVTVVAMNPTGFYNPYAFAGALNINIPGYSYRDSSTGKNINTTPTFSSLYTSNTISVSATLLANVTTSTPAWNVGTNNFTFTSATNGTVITIPNDQLSIFTIGSRTCTITAGSCQISITNPTGYPRPSTVNFLYTVSPAGSSPGSAGIIKTASFTYN